MSDVSTLAWPASPYTSAHRPIRRRGRLLTGLALAPPSTLGSPGGGWAVAHLRTHPTRALDIPSTGVQIGLQVITCQDDALRGWQVLDRLLRAARRQAAAVAGAALGPPLKTLCEHLRHLQSPAPGITALATTWSDPPLPSAHLAELIELTRRVGSHDLRTLWDGLHLRDVDDTGHPAWVLASQATAVALAAAAAGDHYHWIRPLSVHELLRDQVADLLDPQHGPTLSAPADTVESSLSTAPEDLL